VCNIRITDTSTGFVDQKDFDDNFASFANLEDSLDFTIPISDYWIHTSIPMIYEPPSNKTGVAEGGEVLVAAKGGILNYSWIIPNGETFYLRQLEFGAIQIHHSIHPLQAKCILYYRPNGTAIGQQILAPIFLQGESHKYVHFNKSFVGDGVATMYLHVVNLSEFVIDCFRMFRGYY